MKRMLMILGVLVTFLALPGAAQRGGMRGGGMGMGGGMRGGAMGTGGMQTGSMRDHRGPGDTRMERDRNGERQGTPRGQNREADRGGRHNQSHDRGSQQEARSTPKN